MSGGEHTFGARGPVGDTARRAGFLRSTWNERSDSWHEQVGGSSRFATIRDRVLHVAAIGPSDEVVDLGAGTGFLTLVAASRAASVLAVDVSPDMIARLVTTANVANVQNVSVVIADLATLQLPSGSADAIVSSYALHHLTDVDKVALLARARTWLRPGGRLVIADMMFGRGGSSRDRAVLRAKVGVLLRRGPAGVWRIAKNLVRFGLRRGSELPATPEFWTTALHDAGFVDVEFEALFEEAGLVSGRVPGS